MMEINPSSIKANPSPDADMISVHEKGGVFTIKAGQNKLDEAVKRGDKFVAVKVSESEDGGEDSFMNFSKMK